MKISIDSKQAAFPQRCVGCGGAARTAIYVECSSGVDLVVVSAHRFVLFSVPVCWPCGIRRRLVGALAVCAAIAISLGSLLGIFFLDPILIAWNIRGWWPPFVLAMFSAFTVYFARNWLSPTLDAALLGCAAHRYRRTAPPYSGVATKPMLQRSYR